jgi:hypothetical protein
MHQLDVMIQQQFVPSAERGVIWTCSRMPDFVYINNLSASTRQCRIPNLNTGNTEYFCQIQNNREFKIYDAASQRPTKFFMQDKNYESVIVVTRGMGQWA